MAAEPKRVTFAEAVVEFVKVFHEKRRVRSVTFGYDLVNGEDREPRPGEEVRWHVDVTTRKGAKFSRVGFDTGDGMGLMDAWELAAKALGLTVRLEIVD